MDITRGVWTSSLSHHITHNLQRWKTKMRLQYIKISQLPLHLLQLCSPMNQLFRVVYTWSVCRQLPFNLLKVLQWFCSGFLIPEWLGSWDSTLGLWCNHGLHRYDLRHSILYIDFWHLLFESQALARQQYGVCILLTLILCFQNYYINLNDKTDGTMWHSAQC